MTEVGMSTSIAAGVDDLPCLTDFYFYNPYLIMHFLIFPYTLVYTHFAIYLQINCSILAYLFGYSVDHM